MKPNQVRQRAQAERRATGPCQTRVANLLRACRQFCCMSDLSAPAHWYAHCLLVGLLLLPEYVGCVVQFHSATISTEVHKALVPQWQNGTIPGIHPASRSAECLQVCVAVP